jgi:hypothetical protein
MPIIRCSDQNNQTLGQFYSDSDDQQTREIGAAMLSIIKLLDTKFKETTIFGLTSLYRLNLLANDTYKSPWYVSFITDGKNFYIDYLVPESQQPWKHARISGEAESFEQAYKYILIAMTKSGGWADNIELHKLLADT